jgi:hypothetical protein
MKEMKQATWVEMRQDLCILVKELYEEHEYIRDQLPSNKKKEYDQILADPITHVHWKSLYRLSEFLRFYHGRECIVLVDEYDTPLNTAHKRGYYDNANTYFGMMFSSLLKGNVHVYKAVLVGILRVAKSGFLSGLNNLSVHPMYESGLYEDRFGFTHEETRLILRHHAPNLNFDEVIAWYNGYRTGSGSTLMNPWSIINLCQKKKFKAYWVESGNHCCCKLFNTHIDCSDS